MQKKGNGQWRMLLNVGATKLKRSECKNEKSFYFRFSSPPLPYYPDLPTSQHRNMHTHTPLQHDTLEGIKGGVGWSGCYERAGGSKGNKIKTDPRMRVRVSVGVQVQCAIESS